MAMELRIPANILSASTKSVGGKVYGSMLLGIPREEGMLNRALAYLRSVPDIICEEVRHG